MSDIKPRQRKAKPFSGLPQDRRGRKAAIVGSLYSRMKISAYADITLTDIAKEADISVSHLLYYYEDKEKILLDLAELVVTRALSEVFSDQDDDVAYSIEAIVPKIIVEGSVAAVILQVRALAVHSAPLREFILATSEASQKFFRLLFRNAPRQPGMTVDEAAKSAISLWEGLLLNVHFGFAVSETEARELFRSALYWLANLPASTD